LSAQGLNLVLQIWRDQLALGIGARCQLWRLGCNLIELASDLGLLRGLLRGLEELL
jgi:hypothetical protein